MACIEEPEPLLHPSTGELYRTRVEAAIEADDEIERERAKEALRGFIEKIVIPADARQPLQVFDDLGKMLAAASNWPDGSSLAAVANVGCGGSQPPLSATVAIDRLRQLLGSHGFFQPPSQREPIEARH